MKFFIFLVLTSVKASELSETESHSTQTKIVLSASSETQTDLKKNRDFGTQTEAYWIIAEPTSTTTTFCFQNQNEPQIRRLEKH